MSAHPAASPARAPAAHLAGATRRGILLGASTLTAVSAASAARAQPAADRARSARAAEVSKALQAANPTPSLSLAVAQPGGVIWAEAYGKANIELDIAATPAHRFKLGSVSKVLTATAAAKLVSRRLLDLDAPITTWLPDLPAQHRQTTMRQLLTHRGGVRHYIARDGDLASGILLDFRTYPTNKEILATFIDDPLVGLPGAQAFYSTFGFTLASLVMEAAAKQPFPDLIKAEIGAAFGLQSLDDDAPQAIRPMRASGYGDAAQYRAGDPRLPVGWANARQTNPAYKWAGGGFIMTPSDMARFGAAMLDSPASKITPAERALLFTPAMPAIPNAPPIGLAWRIDADGKGRRRWHHAGAQEGGRASLVVYPDLGLSIAFATPVVTVPGNVLQPSSDLADAFA